MAEFRQGYLDDYTQNLAGVGIGTSSPNAKLEIIGGTTSQQLDVTGISTFAYVSGFIKKHTDYTENVSIDAGDSGTLSGEIIVGTGLTMTVGTGATASQGSVDSLKVYNMFQPPSGGTNQRPPAKTGALFYNFDYKTIEFFDGNSWRQVDNTITRGRGVFVGGCTPSHEEEIDFINIQSRGNSQSFGSLSAGRRLMAGLGNSTRGIYGGGIDSSNNYLDTIEYITIQSGGNPIDFGNLTATNLGLNALASSTRGVFTGGYRPSPTKAIDVIQYVEIATLGDALDFGDLNYPRYQPGSCSSPTRGVVNEGSQDSNTLNYITISTTGVDASDFGDSPYKSRSNQCAGGNATRGLFGGGGTPSPGVNSMYYITIATLGNGTDFGDLTAETNGAASPSSPTRVVFTGGKRDNSFSVTCDYVEIASTGNAKDFADLTSARMVMGYGSNGHGGLG